MKIDEMELNLTEKGAYGQYRKVLDAVQDNSPIKYMMAMSETSREQGFSEDLVFVGGLGVLGNIVHSYGVEAIPKSRGMHDVDLILNLPTCLGGLESVLDNPDIKKSCSIPNQYTLSGKSRDYSGETHNVFVDIYVPGRVHAFDDYLSRKVTSDFFGVKVNVLNPLDALRRKLAVNCMNGDTPREKDQQDIYNLLAVLENQGYSPKQVRKEIFPGNAPDGKQLKLFSGILENMKKKDFQRISRVSGKFIRGLKK